MFPFTCRNYPIIIPHGGQELQQLPSNYLVTKYSRIIGIGKRKVGVASVSLMPHLKNFTWLFLQYKQHLFKFN